MNAQKATLNTVSSQRTLSSLAQVQTHQQNLHARKMTQTPQNMNQFLQNAHKKHRKTQQQPTAKGFQGTGPVQSHHTSPTSNFLRSLERHNLAQKNTTDASVQTSARSIGGIRDSQNLNNIKKQQEIQQHQQQQILRTTKSRDSNLSDQNQLSSTGGSNALTLQSSHFTLNNIQSSQVMQKSPFYSPKNISGGIQLHQTAARPATTIAQAHQATKGVATLMSKVSGAKNAQQLNKSKNDTLAESESRTLNASQSKGKLGSSEGKQYQHLTSINNLQESTVITFSPSSTQKLTTPGSTLPQKKIAQNSLQFHQASNLTNTNGPQKRVEFYNPLVHNTQGETKTQESFKSTFVNFRSSMREDVQARKPKVCTLKKSPIISPRKLLNQTTTSVNTKNKIATSKQNQINLQVLDSERMLYHKYMNDYQNSINEESGEDQDFKRRLSSSPRSGIGRNTTSREEKKSKMLIKQNPSKTKLHIVAESSSKERAINTSAKKSSARRPNVGGTVTTQRNTTAITTRDTMMQSPNLKQISKFGNKISPRTNRSQALSLEEQLWVAAESGNQPAISQAISQGANVNAANPNDDGWTALHYASHEGLDQTVELLIRKFNASVNQLTLNGRTALHIACTQQHKGVIERLLLAGANANIKSRQDGNTPLHILARFCNPTSNLDLVKLLLPFSQESLAITNKNGLTPYYLTPYEEIKELLRPKAKVEEEKKLLDKQGDGKPKLSVRNIRVDNVEIQDVKAMFDQLNEQMKHYKPCNQPMGEHDKDDLLFDSASSMLMQSLDMSKGGGFQNTSPGAAFANQTENTLINFRPSSDLLLQTPTTSNQQPAAVLSPKNPGPKVPPQKKSNQNLFSPSSALKQQQRRAAQNQKESAQNLQRRLTSSEDHQQGYVPSSQREDQYKSLQKTISQRNMKKVVDSPEKIEEKRIGPDQFVAHQLLGTGSFGEVYLVEKISNKKLYAMKVLTKSKIRQQNLIKYALTERNVMSVMQHPFIVRLRYAFQTQDKLFLISDYCPGGDLSQYLEIERAFSEEKSKFYICEILLAIEALHERDIIFRDLKPDNVVLDEQGHALLTDFGLSKEGVHNPYGGAKSFCGSYAYLAPEMIKKTGHGKAVDWYLLGVVFYEMLTGMPPYYADEKEILFQNIMNNPLELPSDISPLCSDFLSKLLHKNPLKRLGCKHGAQELKQHPYLQDIDWDKIIQRRLKAPDPYLAEYAKSIIQVSPYMAAGHPKTRGKIIQRDHPQYVQGWSFVESSSKRNSSQDRNAWYVGSAVGGGISSNNNREQLKDSQLQGGLWVNPPEISVPNETEEGMSIYGTIENHPQ